jgi:ankyrin repeat protein
VSKTTPLHIATRKGHADIVLFLLEHNADVTTLTEGCTPLHIACDYGYYDCVLLLLKAGSPVDDDTCVILKDMKIDPDKPEYYSARKKKE